MNNDVFEPESVGGMIAEIAVEPAGVLRLAPRYLDTQVVDLGAGMALALRTGENRSEARGWGMHSQVRTICMTGQL